MAPHAVGEKPKGKHTGRGKQDVRSLKRKRDVEDIEKLQQTIEALVKILILFDCIMQFAYVL